MQATADAPIANVEAEMGLLGFLMRSGDRAGRRFEELRVIAGDESMHAPESRAIWDAMRALHEQGRPLDRVTVIAELRSQETLDDAGGPAALAQVCSRPAQSLGEARAHAALIAEGAVKRQVSATATHLAGQVRGLTGAALEGFLARMVEELSELARSGPGTGDAWTARHVGDQWQGEFERELSGDIAALDTGFPDLNHLAKRKGFRQGWLVVVSGRPKMGKTMLALQMAVNAMFEPVPGYWPPRYQLKAEAAPVFIACDEMRAAEIYGRMLATVSGIDMGRMAAADPDWAKRNDERIIRGRRLLDSAPLVFVPDKDSNDLERINAYVRRWRRKHPIIDRDPDGNPVRPTALVILDFLQSFKDLSTSSKRDNVSDRIGAKAYFCKSMAKDEGLVVLLLSQLNRELERRDDKRPKASDNEGSGKIEQAGDMLIGCYRDIRYDADGQKYFDQLRRLRARVREMAEGRRDTTIARAMATLSYATSGPPGERRDRARSECLLGPTEIEQFEHALRKVTEMEIIVQRNRHGSPGTVYAAFQGSMARVQSMPRDEEFDA